MRAMTLMFRCVYFLLVFDVNVILTYKAAVYEHVVISPDDPLSNFTRDEAFQWMLKNLDIFEQQVVAAAEQDAQIIVFPEYGITGFDHSRDSIVPFLEDIPEPSILWNPCDDPARFPNTRVLNKLSCMAFLHDIYLVANMGDIKTCDAILDQKCPPDGRYQFNTNVVFDSEGTLIGRYHKRNMYDETPLFDPSPSVEHSIFETPFGTFGTVVCFDILNYYPTQVLLEEEGIRNLIVTSAWNVFYPFVLPLQMYSGLAKRNNVNVIASNIRSKKYVMAGSGIFGANMEHFSFPDFNNPNGELLFGELFEPSVISKDSELVSLSDKISGDRNDLESQENENFHFGVKEYGMNFTFVILNEAGGQSSVCYDVTCCTVEYRFDDKIADELFILAASDFSTTYPGNLNLQFCAVHRCLSNDVTTCGGAVSSAKSTFSELKLQGKFDSALVFPFVAFTPRGNRSLSVDMHSYKFDRKQTILEIENLKHPLLSAVVYNSLSFAEPSTGGSTSDTAALHISCSGIALIVSSLLLSLTSLTDKRS